MPVTEVQFQFADNDRGIATVTHYFDGVISDPNNISITAVRDALLVASSCRLVKTTLRPVREVDILPVGWDDHVTTASIPYSNVEDQIVVYLQGPSGKQFEYHFPCPTPAILMPDGKNVNENAVGWPGFKAALLNVATDAAGNPLTYIGAERMRQTTRARSY